VAAAQLHERLAALERQRPARRVLVLGDDVEQLRPQPALELLRERVDDQPVLVHRDLVHVGLCAAKGHQRAEVGRALDGDRVARIEQGGADEREALHPAAGDHQRLGAHALQRLLALGQVLAHARDPLHRRVLQRQPGLVAQHPRGDVAEHVGGERRRVREAARQRQHAVGHAREDRGQLLAAAQARAMREQPAPVSARRHRS
jgi:hypothetical protein